MKINIIINIIFEGIAFACALSGISFIVFFLSFDGKIQPYEPIKALRYIEIGWGLFSISVLTKVMINRLEKKFNICFN